MDERFQFDRELFKAVVHYAVHYACERYDADALGNTKLHKILYFSDILHYLNTGQPLTGAEYQRQQFGPTARHLSWGLKTLQDEGRLSVSKREYHGYAKSDYRSLRNPDNNRVSQAHRQLIEEVVDFVCAKTAVEISEFSHDDVWSAVPMGKRIPYYAAFAMFPAEITQEDIEDATREAARLSPEIEAEERNDRVL
jgi:uncharacterized phage-associated protein